MTTVAACLETLRSQINAWAPDRDKASDGTFPSAAHMQQNPTSDHNTGNALDITDDPGEGVDASDLAEQIRVSRDNRVKYLISDGRISNPDIDDWAWRPYTGSNPHNLHFHTSVKPENRDDPRPWAVHKTPPTGEVSVKRPTVQYGSRGSAVSEAQTLLRVAADGVFGTATDTATRAFQGSVGLPVDGIVGPYTWVALLRNAAPAAPPASGVQRGIIATVFSSTETGKQSAYGEWLDPSDLFVALPAAFPKDALPYMRLTGPKGSIIAQVRDKGPWYDGTAARPADEYWLTGVRPRAESDPRTNSAGIDVSQAVADAVGVPGKGPVDWVFVGSAEQQLPAEMPEIPGSFPGSLPWPPSFPLPIPGFPSPSPSPAPGGPNFNLPVGDLFSVIGRASRIAGLMQSIPKTGMTIDRYLAGVEEGLNVIVHGEMKVVAQVETQPQRTLKGNSPMASTVVQVQSAYKSKINWTQALSAVLQVLNMGSVLVGALPPEYGVPVAGGLAIASNALTWVFKTWFSGTVTPQSVA